MPVVTLLTTWAMGVAPPSLKTLGNVSLIVLGVVIAAWGEIQFVLIGFLFQCGGIVFEAIRLVMVQQLLSGAEFKMDPLVSLYYFAPVCAIMNGAIALVFEVPQITLFEVQNVGYSVLLLNAVVAFLLNVSVVFLVSSPSLSLMHTPKPILTRFSPKIGKTSSLVMTLSGVLKDILLVAASMLIFRDPVSPLQAFGYTIALCGLVYYKLGADTIKQYLGNAQRAWTDFGVRRPALRRGVVFGLWFVVVLAVLGAVSSSGVVGDRYNVVKVGQKAMGKGKSGGA